MTFEFQTTIDRNDEEINVTVQAELIKGKDASHIQCHDNPDYSDSGSGDTVIVTEVRTDEDEVLYDYRVYDQIRLDEKAAEHALSHRDEIITQNRED